MPSWNIDTSRWPIVVHTVEGTLRDEALEAYLREAEKLLQRREPHATILIQTAGDTASARLRRRAIEWQRQNAAALEAHCVGVAYVLTSPLLRFVVMTVLLVTRLPTPFHVCESREDAIAWAQAQLDAVRPPHRAEPR